MGLFGGNKMPVAGKTVLITGGSEGMGLAVAKKLSAKGANVVLVARNTGKLEEALKIVQRFTFISADVSAPGYAAGVLSQASQWNHGSPPDIVWCVAGTSEPGLFVDMDMASLRRQMDVNFYGTTDMAHAVLREWLSPAASTTTTQRHFVMTASTIALYTVPGYAPYAPSKWALRGLADTLSQEVLLYPADVKIHVVYPGTILTAAFEREQRLKPDVTKLLEKDDPQQTADEVAEAAIRGLERGHYFITMNWFGDLQRVGMLGGSFRNNWLVDTVGAWLVAIVWFFVQMDLHGKIRSYGKKHGHPSTYSK
ncbi:NAD(P)-binding domain protein [Moelleriella libera RCEF 2490]|uniref:3-dehydrosphinganine reductase n=1 Tax=Moelleriella libera RCEF 2490 TaxID=1081109 RepID=A0A168BXM2_9HYPO|nr:NAD(P)-binding domain protein [Moelleriella libera RCEF 2490]